MNPSDYILDTQRTKTENYFVDPSIVDIVHAVIGISTEAGELLDPIKKNMFYGKPLDLVNLDEEIGDVMWYVGIYLHHRGISLESVLAKNNAKLRARYPEKFTNELAENRDLELERKILEG